VQQRQSQPEKVAQYTDPRILQANERTLLAWIRTGIALITFGFVITKFSFLEYLVSPQYRGYLPHHIRIGPYLGGALSFFAVAVQLLALIRYRKIFQGFFQGENRITASMPTVLAVVMLVFSALIAVYLAL
jgi:putative membrane protein